VLQIIFVSLFETAVPYRCLRLVYSWCIKKWEAKKKVSFSFWSADRYWQTLLFQG